MDPQLYPVNVVEIIKKGGIGILPTDTLYGIVCSAFYPESVDRIYLLRNRGLHKRFIILISDIKDLEKFNIRLYDFSKKVLTELWPGPFSIDLLVLDKKFEYLHKGTNSLAFRIPDKANLREFLSKTGPLIAPSANTEGETPASTLEEAKSYFPSIDFYIEGGNLEGLPSTIISMENGKIKILRQGQGQVPPQFL